MNKGPAFVIETAGFVFLVVIRRILASA